VKNTSEKEKTVSFKHTAKVILIPHLSEYEQAQLLDSLWWSNDEMENFRSQTVEEVVQYVRLQEGRNITPKQAFNELYEVSLSTVEADDSPLEQERQDATTPELRHNNSGHGFFNNNLSSTRENTAVENEEQDEPSKCISF